MFNSITDLPDSIKTGMPQAAQELYLRAFNRVARQGRPEKTAMRYALNAVKTLFIEKNGAWEAKTGARNNRSDLARLQQIHDMSREGGAKCNSMKSGGVVRPVIDPAADRRAEEPPPPELSTSTARGAGMAQNVINPTARTGGEPALPTVTSNVDNPPGMADVVIDPSSKSDGAASAMQTIHDLAVSNGANCLMLAEPEEEPYQTPPPNSHEETERQLPQVQANHPEMKRDYSTEQRREMAKNGEAMPDGSYPIADKEDLHNAIVSWGRGGAKQSDKEHIEKRARALGATDMLPEDWEGSSKDNDKDSDDTKALDDALVFYGGEVKALGDGKVGGYLVRFSTEDDPDLEGDFFTKDTDFGELSRLPMLYHHGLDAKVGRRRIGTVSVKRDDIGLWVDGQLNLRDAYEKAIYDLIAQRKEGWSSGAASHTVVREPRGASKYIKQWYIAEASVTPAPAEYRNEAIPIKSIQVTDFVLPQVNAEVSVRDAAASAALIALLSGEMENMTPQELKAAMREALGEALPGAVAAEIKRLRDEPPSNAGGSMTSGRQQRAPSFNKTPRGDDAFKSFNWFLKTGDPSGIRTGEAYDQMLEDRNMKATYDLLESTQYQGQEAVPTEVVARIIERRDPISIMRAGGAQILPVGSNAVVLPIEKASPEAFVITTIDGSNTFDQTTVQPMDKLAGTIYFFTRSVPIDIQLIEDSVFNIEGWWSRRIARAWALTENAYFMAGTGTGQPQGAVTGATLGVTSASATAVTAAEIVQLYHKVNAEYRDNVVWAMLGATEGSIRQLTTSGPFSFVGDGGYNGGVGVTGLAQGTGWLVNPKSRVFNPNGMDTLAASHKPILVGNLEAGYVVFERAGLTVFRDPYSLSNKGLVNVLAHFRETGGVSNAAALQYLATPSA